MNLLNRVKANTATVGTGTVTLGSAVVPYQTWANAGAVDQLIYSYLIEDGADWELGIGIYTAAGPTLTRSVTQSQIGGVTGTTAVNLSGVATVACVARREDLPQLTVRTVAVGGETSLTVSNIPAYGNALELVLLGRTNAAVVNAQLTMTVNGLSTAIYDVTRAYWNPSGGSDSLNNQTSLGAAAGNNFMAIAGASVGANVPGYFRMRIEDYANTSFYKVGDYFARQPTGTDTGYVMIGGVQFDLTAAINSATVTLPALSGAFVAGSYLLARVIA